MTATFTGAPTRAGTAARLGLLGLGAIAAFFAGRAFPRAPADRAAPPPAAVADHEAAPAGGPDHAGHRLAPPAAPPADPVVDGRTISAAWRDAVRTAPAAASAVQEAVVTTLEARRRAHDPALRACFGGAGVIGAVELRLAVSVSSTEAQVQVGAPRFVEVADGPPIDARVIACLEPLLAGDDVVARGATRTGEAFLAGYHGPVDYGLRFRFADETEGDPAAAE